MNKREGWKHKGIKELFLDFKFDDYEKSFWYSKLMYIVYVIADKISLTVWENLSNLLREIIPLNLYK